MIDQIFSDLGQVPIITVSRRGWGKSTLVKHIVRYLKDLNGYPNHAKDIQIVFKVFDPSFSWLASPLEYYQIVNKRKLVYDNSIDNIGDCVYVLDLPVEDRRAFIATIIKQDMEKRKKLVLRYGLDTVKGLPLIVYVLEEANQILNSRSLNHGKSGEILSDWISIGRNWKLSGILITTSMVGELATKCRRRSEHLMGRLNSASDLREIKNLKSWEVSEATKDLNRFEFLYGDNLDNTIKLSEVLEFSKPKLYRRPNRESINPLDLDPLEESIPIPPKQKTPLVSYLLNGFILLGGTLIGVKFLSILVKYLSLFS